MAQSEEAASSVIDWAVATDFVVSLGVTWPPKEFSLECSDGPRLAVLRYLKLLLYNQYVYQQWIN